MARRYVRQQKCPKKCIGSALTTYNPLRLHHPIPTNSPSLEPQTLVPSGKQVKNIRVTYLRLLYAHTISPSVYLYCTWCMTSV